MSQVPLRNNGLVSTRMAHGHMDSWQHTCLRELVALVGLEEDVGGAQVEALRQDGGGMEGRWCGRVGSWGGWVG